ncbi:MAG: heat-inducible transcriptional repressor HrcA [Candidatus Cloacimonadia bacterium]
MQEKIMSNQGKNSSSRLTQRQREMLKGIILEYLKTAKPVGSNAIAENYDFSLSPATIRNEMALLTQEGYLMQPHTSAGRIPTEKGYKFYITEILNFEDNLPEQKIQMLQSLLAESYHDIDSMLSSLLKFLANVSGQLSIIAEPESSSGILKQFDLFKIGKDKILLIITLDIGLEKTFVLTDTVGLSDAQLAASQRYLNNRFAGLPLYNIQEYVRKELNSYSPHTHDLLPHIIKEIKNVFAKINIYNIRFEGSIQFLSQPEFESKKQILSLLKLFNNQDYFSQIFKKYDKGDYTVLIGYEIPEGISSLTAEEIFENLVLIFGKYEAMGLPGFIGILGTKRMDYHENIPMVCFASKMITELTTKGSIMPFVQKRSYYGKEN